MKFKPSELKELLSASYNKHLFDIGKFKIDSDLSNDRVKVYTLEDLSDVVVVHRGSQDSQDWIDNLAYLELNILNNSKTYKQHLKYQTKAAEKYGVDNIIVMGHSRGGLYASQLYEDKMAKQLITYNKPLNKHDVIDGMINENGDKNVVHIRTSGDVASSGKVLTKKSENDIVIPSKTLNPLKEHSTSALLNLNDDQLIGSGIFKYKIDYTKMRKKELQQFVKQNKKKVQMNITGLTKKQLVEIVDAMLSNKTA